MTGEYQGPDSSRREGAVAVLDSHVHFWDPLGSISYPWLRDVPSLERSFTPRDFAAVRPADTSAIFVEAGRAEQHAAAEIEWIRGEADQHPWILGAVAHVSLEDPVSTPAVLRRYASDPFVVGVRRNLQDEAAGFMADPAFRAGVRLLGEAGLPFDACVREYQLSELAERVAACPRTVFVLDHLGKPGSAAPGHTAWQRALRRLAANDNVVCKLSGLATEVGPGTPPDLLISLLREALEVFGTERCLYGGDWPVMTLATTYEDWLGLVLDAVDGYPAATADAVLHANAQRVYRVRPAAPGGTPSTRKDAPCSE